MHSMKLWIRGRIIVANNKGFAFYQNFWESIENLDEAQQKEICYAIAKYGITGEMVDVATNPLGFSMTNAFKPAIDNSVERFNNNSANGAKGGRPNKIDGPMLTQFLIEHPDATAAVAAQHFGVSASAIQKREEWKNRNLVSEIAEPAMPQEGWQF